VDANEQRQGTDDQFASHPHPTQGLNPDAGNDRANGEISCW